MFERSGSTLRITAPMHHAGAAALLKAGREALTAEISEIDLSAISEVDSSGLAVLFAWLRDAQARNSAVRIANLPPALLSLAALYGVDEFLPLA